MAICSARDSLSAIRKKGQVTKNNSPKANKILGSQRNSKNKKNRVTKKLASKPQSHCKNQKIRTTTNIL